MIKKTNAAIQKKVMNIKGIKDLILALGYVDVISISFTFIIRLMKNTMFSLETIS